MRAQGVVNGPEGVARGDHVCWVYDDEETFGDVARGYLSEGLARGERLLCVGNTIAATIRGGANAFPDVDDLLARGVLEVLDVAGAYERAGEVRPAQQQEFYESHTRRALAKGYTGLRVVADVTDVAADVTRRPELMEWEHLADDFIGHRTGISAMCAYAGSRLDDDTLTDLASIHPQVHARCQPPFRVWFDDDTITLAGELDALGAPRLSRVLASSPVRRPVVVLDLARVEFVDVAGCRAIARWAVEVRTRGARLVLLGPSRLFRRMWTMLGFASVTGALIEEGGPETAPA